VAKLPPIVADFFVVEDAVDGVERPGGVEYDQVGEGAGIVLVMEDVADIVQELAQLQGIDGIVDALFGTEGEVLVAADAGLLTPLPSRGEGC